MTDQKRRTDDSFGRKVIATLISIVIVQGGSFIYLIGSVVNQLDTTTALAIENKKEIKAYIEKSNDKFNGVLLAIGRIESTTGNTAKSVDRIETSLDESIKNQNRIIPIVNQAQEYMINRDRGK